MCNDDIIIFYFVVFAIFLISFSPLCCSVSIPIGCSLWHPVSKPRRHKPSCTPYVLVAQPIHCHILITDTRASPLSNPINHPPFNSEWYLAIESIVHILHSLFHRDAVAMLTPKQLLVVMSTRTHQTPRFLDKNINSILGFLVFGTIQESW